MSAHERPEGAGPDTSARVGSEEEGSSVGDEGPFATEWGPAGRHHIPPLPMAGILGAWLVLAGGLCYLVATQLPGRPLPVLAVAVLLAGLGALLGVAVHIEHRTADRRLRVQLSRASSMLRSIEAVTDPGLAFLEIDDLLAAVLARTRDEIGGDLVLVLLANEDSSTLRVRASTGATELAPVGSEVLVGKGVLGVAAQWARPMAVADVRPDVDDLSKPENEKEIASLMAAPLIAHGATLGKVVVASFEQRTFGAGDLRLLQVVSDRLAAVVERARLDDLARRSRFGAEHASMHLRMLARGGTVLGKALETYDTALGDLADVVVPEFADWFSIDVLEDSGKVRRVASRASPGALGGHVPDREGHPHPKGGELVERAMAERRAQFVIPTSRLDPAELAATIHGPETLGECPGVSSVLVVPVQVRGTITAALSFVTGSDGRGFRPSDLETGNELAERVGVTIERVRSWRASQRVGEMAFHYAERLRRLVGASLVVNAQFSEEEVLHLLVEHAHGALGAEVVVVGARTGDGPLTETVWPSARGAKRAVVSEGEGAGGNNDLREVLLEASACVTSSGGTIRRPDEQRAGNGPPPARGWVAAPITDGQGEVRRVVVAVGELGARFSFEDESVLTLLAQMASVALRNARLYAEIRGNEQRLQTLVDSSPLAIAELRATGEAEWWNRAADELFAWSDPSASRRIPVREGSELVLAGLLDSAFGGKPIIGIALPVTGAEGQLRELSVSASPLGAQGTVTGLLLVAEDVTERQRMLDQFYQAERLNAMSRMAGAVAHDFNNLLTVILGCSDVLMRQLSTDEELGPDVAAIQRAGTRAAALTNQLVRIGGQPQPVRPELVTVDEVLASMRPMLSSALGGSVSLEITANSGGASVLLDRSELERSVLNLAINARDAMPGGGTFTIESARVGRSGAVRRPGAAGLLELSFADTGTGMGEDAAAHCFEPFFTTKGRARGTGLGLAVVQAMVSQAGGDVRVETSPGTGSRFTLTFPVVEARVDAKPSELTRETAAVAPGVGGETLLVVDDEPEVLRLEVRELRGAGYEVLGAANASEALHILDARGGVVDLLVTDVVMPGMNGIELAAAVRWRHPGTGVVFVSGHLDDEATGKSRLPEQASLLRKPFAPDELTHRVREAVVRSRAAASKRRSDGAQAFQGSKR